MMPAVIFFIGVAVGFMARRFQFCIFGAVTEGLMVGNWHRIFGVLTAILVFSAVHITGYSHGAEYPSLKYFVGGVVQGIGYFLAMGCPLSLLVRVGEGSRFHAVVFLGFIAGLALYLGLFDSAIGPALDSIKTHRAVSILNLFH